MTDEQARNQGLQALARGMPWTNWLLDGRDGYRVLVADLHEDSWPDLRDPVTEAWFVAWARELFEKTVGRPFSMDRILDDSSLYGTPEEASAPGHFEVYDRSYDMFELVGSGATRAEAWLMALSHLKSKEVDHDTP